MLGNGLGLTHVPQGRRGSGGGGAYAAPMDAIVATPLAGFGLRKLRGAYAGQCIKVRRSSDNTTLDIGFVNNVLDTASLLTFCGAGDGFINTMYDQVGTNNAVQATAANQPKIVSAGAVLTRNSKPAVIYNGTANAILFTALTWTSASAVIVAGNSTAATARMIIGGATGAFALQQTTAQKIEMDQDFQSAILTSAGTVPSGLNVIAATAANGAQVISINGTATTGTAAQTFTPGTSAIGFDQQGVNSWFDDAINEVLFYASALSTSDRQALEANCKSFYGTP